MARVSRLLAAGLSLIGTALAQKDVDSTVLVIARDAYAASTGTSGLQGYAIPYQTLIVPSTGAALPALNSSTTKGNFGAIVIISEVSYDYGGNFASALTPAQFQTLFSYQENFGVRMVRLDVYPNVETGTVAGTASANDDPIYFTDNSQFPTAGIKTGLLANMSTAGLYHYPATISNTTTTREIARFNNLGTAAVINTFGKRQQMAFFLPFATDWSATSNFLQHAWIQWATRGLYTGYRRILFNTQVDDVFLATEMYDRPTVDFRLRTADLDAHRDWIPRIQAKMPLGSVYFPELGHNGNGDIEASVPLDPNGAVCKPAEAIEYPEQIDTPLEFQKPIGTGSNIWPNTPATYVWTQACSKLDTLERWFNVTTNRDAFAHVSHTFSHMSMNNATYSDVAKEIQFNRAWFAQTGIDKATKWSTSGLIPPAITGLHNGDAIRAWMTNGIRNVVGDNTRAPLRNANTFWPLISNVANNGYAGLVIVPRWATTIYYNCDTPDCTLLEWINTSAGSGDFQNLLKDARITNGRNLLGLHQDPYMFHQANLRYSDMPNTVVNGVPQKLSLLQIWVETMVNEMTRLVSWPMVSLTHDQTAAQFMNRMTRDNCQPKLTWKTSADGTKITAVTLSALNNRCSVGLPITIPDGTFTSTTGVTSTEKLGSDPTTNWVSLTGQARTFNLASPLSI